MPARRRAGIRETAQRAASDRKRRTPVLKPVSPRPAETSWPTRSHFARGGGGQSVVWSGPIRVEESIEIAASPEAVWAVVADPHNDPHWCPKVKAVEEAGDARWTLSHKPVPLRAPTELTVEHLEVEPPSRLTLREEDEASIFNVEYRLTPSGVGTRFTQISEFEWSRCRGSVTDLCAWGASRRTLPASEAEATAGRLSAGARHCRFARNGSVSATGQQTLAADDVRASLRGGR
jgi:uncharacterized protein YndB with AHSA1/START domain